MGRAGLQGPRHLSGDVQQDQSQGHRGHLRRDRTCGQEEVTRCTKTAGSRPRRPPRGDCRGPVPHSHPSLLTTTLRALQAELGQSVPTAAWGCPHPPSTPWSLPSARAWACRRGRQVEEATVLGPHIAGQASRREQAESAKPEAKSWSRERNPQTPSPPRPTRRVSTGSSLSTSLCCARVPTHPGQPLQDTPSFRCRRQRLGKNLQDALHGEVSVTNSVLSHVRREGEALGAATSAAM